MAHESLRQVTRVKQDKAREHRIAMEAVVDAYHETERAMGWYYYLEAIDDWHYWLAQGYQF